MESNLCVVYSFVLFLCSTTYAVDNLEINVDQNSGTFQISLSNQLWFNSGGVWARNNGVWYTTEEVFGTEKLELTGKSTATGKLDWGPMNIYNFHYMSNNQFSFTTYIVVFDEVPAVIFGQQWDSGAIASSTGNTNDTISMWPTFKVEDHGVDRGYVTWAGPQLSKVPLGKFDSSLEEIYSNADGGLPVAIFDSKMENTVVISPQNTFMSSHQQVFTPSSSKTPIYATGILGSVDTVPKGYSMETLLVAGNNVTGTMEQWGRLMKLRYKRRDHYRLNDYTINYLGYYTDNGACYYYSTGKFSNYEEIIIAVKKDADANGIPYRYVELDSWWYYKGVNDGVKNWTAMPNIFPRGIGYVANVTGWPIVAHNRYFAPNTDYASQNGGKYNFIIDDKTALPDDPKFWTDLFSDARDHWNLHTYEQDWLSVSFSDVAEMKSEIGLGERWLSDMAYAAKELDLTIQYCTTYPRHVLQSIMLPAVTQVRASSDYGPGSSQWRIADSSIFLHAIGIAPYKDTFHTEPSEGPGCKFHKLEPAPALEMYVSVLSGGPVGPSDTIDGANKILLMATCAQDGLLLKPSRPALSLDSTFVQRAFGEGGPSGDVSAAYTEISGMTWYYILGVINMDYSMPLTDLPPSHSLKPKTAFPQSIAVQYDISGAIRNPVMIDGKIDPSKVVLSLNTCLTIDFQYWLIAPVLPKVQVALLGDLSKVVSVSEQRVVTVIEFGATYIVKLRGVPGEKVTMTTMDYGTGKTATFPTTIGQDGVGTIAIS